MKKGIIAVGIASVCTFAFVALLANINYTPPPTPVYPSPTVIVAKETAKIDPSENHCQPHCQLASTTVGELPYLPPAGFGELNPAVTQDTIGQTICATGWTATVRPPTSYTNQIKYAELAERGLPKTVAADYELDHDIPLELGGSPTSLQNLFLEPWNDYVGGDNLGAHSKDKVENYLKREVCAGRMPLSQAQETIRGDGWIAIWRQRYSK